MKHQVLGCIADRMASATADEQRALQDLWTAVYQLPTAAVGGAVDRAIARYTYMVQIGSQEDIILALEDLRGAIRALVLENPDATAHPADSRALVTSIGAVLGWSG